MGLERVFVKFSSSGYELRRIRFYDRAHRAPGFRRRVVEWAHARFSAGERMAVMGEQNVRSKTEVAELRRFLKHLLRDVRAMERMLEEGLIESGVRRIGAEQELFLVDDTWRPAPLSTEVLQEVRDPHFTPELARFNLEFNLDPLPFGGDCLRIMEDQLHQLLDLARTAAARCGARPVLTGILPTLTKSDLSMDNMTPNPRYFALNEAMTRLRGGEYEFQIHGIDELAFHHDSIMVEACNTSFQVHFQVDPDQFAPMYNAAQAAAGPTLAAVANSPLLFGKRLWQETRVALFQQSIDTRRSAPHLREQAPRVSFGRQWVRSSVLEIFREDIARFRAILSTELDENPLQVLDRGGIPSLDALRLHNSTVYRWNRVCYGIGENGSAHLRIENRALPSGPTVRDEVANAALWFGLVSGLLAEYGDVSRKMLFEDVHTNFFAAAQHVINSQQIWIGGKVLPARELLLKELIPLARHGLETSGIEAADIDRYLGLMEERVEAAQPGAQWLLGSFAAMGSRGPLAER
ncbi:MAG TPA: hypothetical protein ENK19_02020, partial [Acidobacteria bacterium]|nr:hypothetical protein [Acidobacteriota bacterium]